MSAALAPGLAQRPACFHCGLAVPAQSAWTVLFDAVLQPLCCPGCQAVALGIVDNGLGDYYRNRIGGAGTAAAEPVLAPALVLLDDAAGWSGTDTERGAAVFGLEGIRCAACVWLIERRLARVPGVLRSNLNVSGARVHVEWTRALCQPSDIVAALGAIGYPAYPYDPRRQGASLERQRKTLFRQLFIAGLSMMQVMMYALPVYLAGKEGIGAPMLALMRWASLLLTLPALLYSAQPFFLGAWRNLRNRVAGMDVPVALAIGAAFGASLVATWRGRGDVYFDSITMFIFLLLCCRYLELAARRKAAAALDQLHHALPASAWRLPGYPALRAAELVAAKALRVGDAILVKPGESIAADGVILEGASAIDLALLTGESAWQARAVGASVPGGAVNVSEALVLQVTRVAGDSTLSMLVQLIERAGHGKPRLASWADRVAGWFVLALLALALAVFVIWEMLDPGRAWPIAIAVLVVSCPCALSLATPAALAAATDRLVRRGVLIVQPHVLETLQRATHVVFDKTGTLTEGKPVLRAATALGALPLAACLQLAAALEASNAHPLGAALVRAARQRGGPPCYSALELRHVVGQGMEGRIDGVQYRLGSAAFVQCAFDQPVCADASSVFLANDAGILARFDLADALRADAHAVVRQFQAAGKTVMLLSGDTQGVARALADQLGIATAQGGCLPDAKRAFVQALQAQGAIVAMVGDGINDAVVLRTADVSFAMGSGAALAQLHADCILLPGRLGALSDVADAAAQTVAVIRQNLAWACLYNLVAIPAAALGWLNPWLCGVGMSASSAIVLLNALRLRRAKA